MGCGLSAPPSGERLQPLWSAPIASTDTPLVGAGKVFVRGIHAGHPEEKPHLFALDAATGKELWMSPDPVPLDGSAHLTADGHLVLPGAGLFDAQTGHPQAATDPMLDLARNTVASPSHPSLGQWSLGELCVEDRVYFVDAHHQLKSVLPKKVLWSVPTPIPKGATTAWLGWNQDQILVLVPTSPPTLTAHQRTTGQQLWSTSIAGSAPSCNWDARIIQDSTLLLPGQVRMEKDGANWREPLLWAIDLHTGKEKWRYQPCERIVEVSADQVVVSRDMGVQSSPQMPSLSAALSLSDGQVRWKKDWPILGPLHDGLDWQACSSSWPDLQPEYTGDKRGSKNLANHGYANLFQSNLQAVRLEDHQAVFSSQRWPATQMCPQPTLANGTLYISTLAEMKEGHSAVEAYTAPQSSKL